MALELLYIQRRPKSQNKRGEEIMKKSNILIAVIAVLAAASMAKAGEIDLDFDGRNSALSLSVREIFMAGEGPVSPVPHAVVLEKASVKDDGRDNSKEVYDVLDRSIRTAIMDCEQKGFSGLRAQFGELLSKGSVSEKRDFVYNKTASYKFPERFFPGSERRKDPNLPAAVSGGMKDVCMEYETRKTCINRNVCRVVCAIGGVTAGAAIGVANPTPAGIIGGAAAGAAVGSACQELCSLVEECTTSEVCVRWYMSPL